MKPLTEEIYNEEFACMWVAFMGLYVALRLGLLRLYQLVYVTFVLCVNVTCTRTVR